MTVSDCGRPDAPWSPPLDRARPASSTPRRRASATTAIPATSCGSSCGASRRVLLVVCHRHRPRTTSDGVTADLGRVVSAVPDRPSASCSSRSPRSPPSSCRPSSWSCSSCQQRWRRLGLVVLGAARRAPASGRARSTRDSISPAGFADAVTSGTWVRRPASPRSPYVAGAGRGRHGRQAVAVAAVAARRRHRRRWCSRVVMAVAGHAPASPSCCSPWPPAWPSAPRVLVVFGAPNRRPTPAAVADGAADAGLDVPRLDARARRRRTVAALRGRRAPTAAVRS